MKELINNLNLTKESTIEEIEIAVLGVEDYSYNYYLIKGLDVGQFWEVSNEVYKNLQK